MKKILFVAAEALPFFSTGGLGDVIGSLPTALSREGLDMRVILPLHSKIDNSFREALKKECEYTVRLSWREQYAAIFSLKRGGVTYYFIDNEYYFKRGSLYGEYDDGERYAFFSMAVAEGLSHIGFYPDVLHAHDWQCALSIIYLNAFFRHRPEYRGIKTVFTIHNIEYQGSFDTSLLGEVFSLGENEKNTVEWNGRINLMKGGIESADRVTTVSSRYADEIKSAEFGHGLDAILRKNAFKLSGILNGIDYEYYNPERDSEIAKNFSTRERKGKDECKKALQRELSLPERNVPLLSAVSRLAGHKGLDLIVGCLGDILEKEDIQFVLLGQGDPYFENFFRELEGRFPDKARALITYDRSLAKRVYSASDIFIMPSRSEPCGLSQMIASRYGAIPIVRETGGLFDSIKPFFTDGSKTYGNGFTFYEYSPEALKGRILASLDVLRDKKTREKLYANIADADFSWTRSAKEYITLYANL